MKHNKLYTRSKAHQQERFLDFPRKNNLELEKILFFDTVSLMKFDLYTSDASLQKYNGKDQLSESFLPC